MVRHNHDLWDTNLIDRSVIQAGVNNSILAESGTIEIAENSGEDLFEEAIQEWADPLPIRHLGGTVYRQGRNKIKFT